MQKWALTAVLAAIAGIAHGKCLDVPSVEVLIEVTACHATSYGAGLERDPAGEITTSTANVSGVTLTGKVISSGLRWRYPPPHRKLSNAKWEPKPPLKGSYERVLVISSEFKDCPTFLKKPVSLISSGQCCDTIPHRDTCAVPQKIYQLITPSVDSWPIQVGK